MPGQCFVLLFLILAIVLSWPRCAAIFRPDAGLMVAASPLTMVATAVSLTALGLAFAEHGLWLGSATVVTGLLIATALRGPAPVISVALSAISFAAFFQLRSALIF
ncbi:hypothetical protein [Pararhizobium sp.]|uniref:hypothetical protein n=1 Tax=Pararhizobium sp. TaxID=1977563 RepID=UPI0027240B96|nr:hypothetical protein [Pararhizobium sp.]MDO9417170.1 hypothetical protein [Pararhizobium sp.]